MTKELEAALAWIETQQKYSIIQVGESFELHIDGFGILKRNTSQEVILLAYKHYCANKIWPESNEDKCHSCEVHEHPDCMAYCNKLNKMIEIKGCPYLVIDSLRAELDAERAKGPCDTCEGSGIIWFNGDQEQARCPDCKGKGRS